MFVVKCPHCDKRSKGFVDQGGLRGKCPHCGKKITIAATPGEVPEEQMVIIRAEAGAVAPKRRTHAKLPNTNAPSLLVMVPAVILTWLFYALGARWCPGTWAEPTWKILLSCLWIGNAEVFAFFWGLFLLLWKARLVLDQARPLRWEVFPERFGAEPIRPESVDTCLAHLDAIAGSGRYILLNRVRLALEHYRQTRSVAEVRGALTGQSAIDANLMDSSYSVPRFIIWVIPILGFIGTVVGIGIAVSNFGDFIPKVSEVEKAMDSLRKGLGQVTTGLGTAFNTTLVALVLVTPLMLATAWLRKQEEELLAHFDQFSNQSLIGKLADWRTAEASVWTAKEAAGPAATAQAPVS